MYKQNPETLKYIARTTRNNYKNNIRDRSADEIRSKKNKLFTESVEPKFKTGLKMIKKINDNKDVDIEHFKKGLKKFPNSNKSIVGKVLKGDKDVPIYKERFHVKLCENNGQPSELYIKMNNKFSMLPHQYLPVNKKNVNNDKYSSTYNDLFKRDFKNNNVNNNINNKENFVKYREKYHQEKDHLGPVLTYEGVHFRNNNKFATKPNRVPYEALLKQIEQNKINRKEYKYQVKDGY